MGAVREAVGVASDTMGPMDVAGLLVMVIKPGETGEGAEETTGGTTWGEGSSLGTSLREREVINKGSRKTSSCIEGLS